MSITVPVEHKATDDDACNQRRKDAGTGSGRLSRGSANHSPGASRTHPPAAVQRQLVISGAEVDGSTSAAVGEQRRRVVVAQESREVVRFVGVVDPVGRVAHERGHLQRAAVDVAQCRRCVSGNVHSESAARLCSVHKPTTAYTEYSMKPTQC